MKNFNFEIIIFVFLSLFFKQTYEYDMYMIENSTKQYSQINLVKNSNTLETFKKIEQNKNRCESRHQYMIKEEQKFLILRLNNTNIKQMKNDTSIILGINSEGSESKVFEIKRTEREIQLVYPFQCKDQQIFKELQIKVWEMGLLQNDIQIYKECISIPQWEWLWRDKALLSLMLLTILVVAVGSKQTLVQVEDNMSQMQQLSIKHACLFLLASSLSLLTFYLFIDYLQTLLFLLVLLASYTFVSFLFSEISENYYSFTKLHLVNIKFIGKLKISEFIGYIISTVLLIYYIYYRDWISNNIIAICICMASLKIIEIPSFKVATILLGFAFIYDIFWVFGSQLIFKHSVMSKVASEINLPIKLVWPSSIGIIRGCSMVGLGDIVLPGLLGCFCNRLDQWKNTSSLYYKQFIIGYIVSLILCCVTLILTNHPQPALLYIVPVTLILIAKTAYHRSHLLIIWQGITIQNMPQPYQKVNPDSKDCELQSEDQGFVDTL